MQRSTIIGIACLAASGACTAKDPLPSDGCVVDTDCRGDRVCEDGDCVEPYDPGNPSATVAASASAASTSTGAGGASSSTGTGASSSTTGPGSTATSSSSSGQPSCGNFDTGTAACNTCAEGACCTELEACDVGSPCATFFGCVNACAPDNQACISACQSGGGLTEAQALYGCLASACPTDCGLDNICTSGFSIPGEVDCATCLGNSCCAEYTSCFDDASCQGCLLDADAAKCAAGMLDEAVTTCGSTHCATECPGLF